MATYRVRPSTYFGGPGCGWQPAFWNGRFRVFEGDQRGTGFSTDYGRERRWPMVIPSIPEDLGKSEEVWLNGGGRNGTLNKYSLDVFRPDFAGAVL